MSWLKSTTKYLQFEQNLVIVEVTYLLINNKKFNKNN